MKTFAAMLIVLWGLSVVQVAAAQETGKETPAPVVRDPYASPRDTMHTFLENMDVVSKGLESNRPVDPQVWQNVFDSMQVSAAQGEAARKDNAILLKSVLDSLGASAIELDPPSSRGKMLPDRDDVQDQKLEKFMFFPDNSYRAAKEMIDDAIAELGPPPAGAVISFVRDSGGEWKFSSATFEYLSRLREWSRQRIAYGEVDIGKYARGESMRRWIPQSLQGRYFFGVELWQWVGLAITIFLALLADVLTRMVLSLLIPRLVVRYLPKPSDEIVRTTVRPMGLAIGAMVFLFLLNLMGLVGMPQTILNVAGKVVLVVSFVWAAWMLTDLLSEVFLVRAKQTPNPLDDMIVPLLRKTAKLFICAMGVIYMAGAFAIDLVPLLASFGIAGLAISFAAQDMVKNLFGGLAIFLDRPFTIGERIQYKGFDGNIEDIGFRTTRLRTLVGHLVTLPNSGFTSDPVENIARRPSIRRIMNITITYDTPRQKIEQAVQIIRDIFEEPDLREPIHQYIGAELMAPRVFFNDYNSDSLNIFAIYWYIPPEWWPYNEHAQKVNFRIFEEFEKAGIEFAFPTQTLYLAGDPKRQLAVKMLENPSDGQ